MRWWPTVIFGRRCVRGNVTCLRQRNSRNPQGRNAVGRDDFFPLCQGLVPGQSGIE